MCDRSTAQTCAAPALAASNCRIPVPVPRDKTLDPGLLFRQDRMATSYVSILHLSLSKGSAFFGASRSARAVT
eukprot:scaffold2636_cov340-Pavlova_lutheri.AAC.168